MAKITNLSITSIKQLDSNIKHSEKNDVTAADRYPQALTIHFKKAFP